MGIPAMARECRTISRRATGRPSIAGSVATWPARAPSSWSSWD
ncbi:MAG: hypothetical protein ACLQIB_37440 [Isosphaeraceae bacterium]